MDGCLDVSVVERNGGKVERIRQVGGKAGKMKGGLGGSVRRTEN